MLTEREWRMQNRPKKNETVGIIICFVIMAALGYVAWTIYDHRASSRRANASYESETQRLSDDLDRMIENAGTHEDLVNVQKRLNDELSRARADLEKAKRHE